VQSVYLRALEREDIERTHKWHSDPSLYSTLGGTFRFASRQAEEEWLSRACAYSASDVNLAICISDTREHIGNIYIRGIDWVSRHAELHIFLGEASEQGKGYGATAVRLAMRHAFQDLGLHRVYLEVLEDNQKAMRAYEKCGFKTEGNLREHAFKDGAYKNVLVMGVCAGEAVWETSP
jgi:diamine N-acetyltransferase